MKFKKIMLVTLMLLAIISIGAASASEDIADDNVTSIEPTDDLTVSQVDDENVIHRRPVKVMVLKNQIAWVIDGLEEGDVLVLQ